MPIFIRTSLTFVIFCEKILLQWQYRHHRSPEYIGQSNTMHAISIHNNTKPTTHPTTTRFSFPWPPLSLEMSSLLRATTHLESTRVQVYKDLTVSLLGGLGSRGGASHHTQQRLLSVLHGQLQGMEGRLKEEHVARMAALAAQCNLETRQEMEAEHRREAAEKASAEVLCQHADQQVRWCWGGYWVHAEVLP